MLVGLYAGAAIGIVAFQLWGALCFGLEDELGWETGSGPGHRLLLAAPLAWTLLFAARGGRRRWQWTGRNGVWVGAVLALAFLVARPWFVFIVS